MICLPELRGCDFYHTNKKVKVKVNVNVDSGFALVGETLTEFTDFWDYSLMGIYGIFNFHEET